MTNLLIYGLFPLIAFALLDALSSNIRLAVLGALVCSLLELSLVYFITARVDPVSLTATLLFIALGLLSIRLDNRVYFKLQPAVLALVAAAFISYLQFFGQPVVDRYLPLMKQLGPAVVQPYLENQDFLKTLSMMFSWLILLILLDAAWIAYTALKCHQVTWLLVNALGFWILAALMAVGQIAYFYFVGYTL